MSTLTRAGYKTAYSDPAGQFPTNTTRLITAVRQRTAFDDTADSAVFKNDDYDYWLKVVTASGTDTYTITPTVPVAYASDEKWLIRFTNSNGGAATLNRNSLGAKSLLTNSGGALSPGDIVAGGIYIVNYNGTDYRILNVVAGTGSVSGLTSPRIPYATSATTLGDNANLTWDNTNLAINFWATRFVSNSRTYDDIFWGEAAGNFTATGGAGGNVGLGYHVLDALTNGDHNIAVGVDAGTAITTGDWNVAIGYNALKTVDTGYGNVAIGYDAGAGLVSGDSNVFIGINAGENVTGSRNTVIGYGSQVRSNSASYQLSIGGVLYGSYASNDRYIDVECDDATSNTVMWPLRITRYTNGSPGAGIGVGMQFITEASAANNEIVATIEAITTDVTAASEDADLVFKTMVAGAAATEHLRFGSNKIGFFGVTTVAKATTAGASATFVANTSANIVYQESTFDGYKIDQIVKALRNYGLLT